MGLGFYKYNPFQEQLKDFEIQISTDNTTWENVVVSALEKTAVDQNINLSEPKTFRYLKLMAKIAHDVTYNAIMAEISA